VTFKPFRTPALLFIAALACAPLPSRAQATSTIGTMAIPKLTAAPPLDPHATLDAWKGAAPIAFPWDVTHQRPASEPSSALIGTDGSYLYLRFDVKQREGLLAQQHANNIGDGTDDEVWIDLWPSGKDGFFYQFAATSNGTHYQYSSENTAYAPTWDSAGVAYDGGFTVTMKIPMRVIRGSSGGGGWRAQFIRVIRSTGERQAWSYMPVQTNGDDVTYSGSITGLLAAAVAKPQPRFGLYGLGVMGAAGSGLSTSRLGADLSIPITSTSSFFSTIHPDFSNVEVDQSTISPTAFARQYNEVRPFFTQTSNYFNQFDCDACPGYQDLYTPSIPTPRDGYGIEGRQGPVRFAAFDAIGVKRTDAAQTIAASSANNQIRLTLQRVSADSPFYHDDVTSSGVSYNDNKHMSGYFNYGSDQGSLVTLGNQAQRYDGGFYYYTNTFGTAFSARKIGYYYNPVDGFVQHPDIAGYAGYIANIWLFDKKSKFNSAGVSVFWDRYHNQTGALDQSDNNVLVDVLSSNRIDAQVSIGSSYLLANNCATSPGNLIQVTPLNYATYAYCQVFTPISQNGASITWHSGTVNNPGNFPNHNGSSTPTTISFNTGRFGPGRLDSWGRVTTMRAGIRGTLTLEADDTRQYLDSGATLVQWLERAGYTYTLSADDTIAFGVRRLIGTAPYIVTNAPTSCVTYTNNSLPTSPCTGAWNLSFSYHKRTPHDEFYFAYGDASQLSTVPQWVFKWIRYFGAEKGT
jgi:hypothetical protein